MAVTTTYLFDPFLSFSTESIQTNLDLTGLSGGGLAAAGDHTGHVDSEYFDSGLQDAGASENFAVANASLDQLTNGNVVIVGEKAAGLALRITGPTGATVLANSDIADSNNTQADVAALSGGGFVITSTDSFGGTDKDIDFRLFDSAGALTGSFSVDSSGANDSGASVVGLNDGGFAIAWTRTVGAATQLWTAVYEANGGVRMLAALHDNTGTINTDASVVALDDGGFAVAYTDNGWDGAPEITLSRFDAAGVHQGFTQVSDMDNPSSGPSIAKLTNGLLAVSFTSEFSPTDHDLFMQLIDPASGDLLLADPQALDESLNNTVVTSAAGFGLAGVAISVSGGSFNLKSYHLTRDVQGDSAANVVTGDDAIDRMDGNDGSDSLSGMNNNDTLEGEGGNDTLLGGDGDDVLRAGSENDSLDGGNGVDLADYAGSAAVTIDLGFAGPQNTGGSGIDRFANVEHVIGTSGADNITGNGAANSLVGDNSNDTLAGVGGNDTLSGGGGADNLNGGANNDLVFAGFGADAMSGGGGIDTLDYSMFTGETFLDLSTSASQNTHSAGNDSVIGFEHVLTGNGDDRIRGNGSDNLISTNEGADTIKSGGGDDTILAGLNADVINGGGGADVITGGHGRDEMRGGAANDRFDYDVDNESGVGVALCDLIRDFRTTDNDRIDLSDIDAGTLAYIGSAAFGGVGDHEVRVTTVAEGQLVQVDIDGDGDSDMDILAVNSGLSGGAADFVL